MCGSGQTPAILQSRWPNRVAIEYWMKLCGADGFIAMAVAAISVRVHIVQPQCPSRSRVAVTRFLWRHSYDANGRLLASQVHQ